MPHTSPFFNSTFPGQSSEQGLVDDLVREQIKIYGVDIFYMPRRHLNLDTLLHESSKVAFELAMPIPMYIKTVDGFDNGMEVLSKFGVRSSDEITLVMSRSEFTAYYAPYIKSYYNSIKGIPTTEPLDPLIGETENRPKEGDLIFFPFDNSIFEIKYVQFDQPFFQLGRGYVFEIQCEKFEYSGEDFKTGYDTIDDPHTTADYYRLEFDIAPSYSRTFHKYEKVTIYNIGEHKHYYDQFGNQFAVRYEDDETYLVNEDGDVISTEFPILYPYEIQIDNDEDFFILSATIADEIVGNFIIETPSASTETESTGLLLLDNVKNFILYRDPGLLHRVVSVSGTVMDWNARDMKLVLGSLSDLDPDQEDEDFDITINKFDTVMITGDDSGSYAVARKAGTRPKPFDDADIIQKEYDEIKIVDPFDDNPFGFV